MVLGIKIINAHKSKHKIIATFDKSCGIKKNIEMLYKDCKSPGGGWGG